MIIQKEPTINSLSFGQLSAFVLTLPSYYYIIFNARLIFYNS